jgi:HAE1 family hydrophobic/amphiphilic exporter-1
MSMAKNSILPQFQLIPGVGDVFLGGYLEPNIRIWIDLQKLRRYELTVDDVAGALGREHVEYPSGTLDEGEKEYTLRVLGEATTPEEMAKLQISKRGGAVNYQPVRLGDIARIESGTEDVRRLSRVLGEPAVGIGIRKQRGTNSVEVARAIKARLPEIEKTLPEGLKIGINYDGTKFIEENVKELQFELMISALLTGLVCWLFFWQF